MAIVKATFTRQGRAAKASVRYIENRPGKDGVKIQRTLFKGDGKVGRSDVYDVIDQADKNSYFFRLVISPDPEREDREKSLDLRALTESTMRELEARFQQMRRAATEEALAQRRQLDLAREQRELSQEQSEGLGLSW